MRRETTIAKLILILITLILIPALANSEEIKASGLYNYPSISVSNNQFKPIDKMVGHYINKINYIFSDIDGTLIPFSKTGPRGQVPKSVIESAKKIKDAKIPLVLVTGRSAAEGKKIAQAMGNEKTYIIGQQGAEILSPDGKLIYENFIDNKSARKIINEINKYNKSFDKNSKIFFYVNGQLYAFEEYTLPYIFDQPTIISGIEQLPKNFTTVKIGIYDANQENLQKIQKHMKQKFPKYNILISADCYCDISTITSTKGNALKKLSQLQNIDLSKAAAFGDAENDVSMLSLIKNSGGLAIAVGNAMESVKNSANYITAPVYEDGFAKAIDEILLNNMLIQQPLTHMQR